MRKSLGVRLALSTVLIAGTAFAWKREASFGAKTHDHEFNKVVLEASECTIQYRLYFTAPPQAYPKAKQPSYRFHARIRLENGRSIVSPVFSNETPGTRTYSRSFDTTPEGCWAKQEHKLFGVDVESCRGRGCTPEPFE